MLPGSDPAVEAGFLGSLTICEDGELRPSRNLHGDVVDRFGVYRAAEDERDHAEERFAEGDRP